jgi:predicted alpha/beta-fold hydrolase
MIIESNFVPARWLKNRQLQTIYPSLPWAWRHKPELRREVLRLPDGDVTVVDWHVHCDELPDTAPLLVILHGLEGSADSSYARMLMEVAFDRGWRSCVLQEPLATPVSCG